MAPGADEVGPAAAAPARSALATLRGITTLVAPTSLVTALLFYFGWARTSRQAYEMGLDESLFGYSTSDYILRSITTMFWPLFDCAIAILIGLLLHARLLAWAGVRDGRGTILDERRGALGRLALALFAAGALLFVLGMIGSRLDWQTRLVSIGAPLAVTASIAVLAYAVHVRQLSTARGDAAQAPASTPLAGVAWGTVTVLLLLSMFWTVSHYAAIKGIDFAQDVERLLPTRPIVTIYSERRLHIGPPVVEEALAGDDAAYRYRYAGLRLLFRADGRLFLRPNDVPGERNIVVAEDATIRVEYR